MKKHVPFFGAIVILGQSFLQCDEKDLGNKLNKIFHHQGVFSDRIICYFSKNPVCNCLPERLSKYAQSTMPASLTEQIVFFLPFTHIQDKNVKQAIRTINNRKNSNYIVEISEVDKPLKGIRVFVAYNPLSVACEYAVEDSISRQKSIIFSFHNKLVLDEIQRKTDLVLRHAWFPPSCKNRFKIALDFGHGGYELGAVTAENIQEKDVTLSVGSKIAHLLRMRGYDVFLTRQGDNFVALDERTLCANKQGADLFLSIHANSGPSLASGIETYWSSRQCLKPIFSTDNTYMAVLGDIQKRLDESSSFFATCIHKSLLQNINQSYRVQDRGVKQVLAQVLIGSNMPAALVEIGFLSHYQECKKLTDQAYQQLIAQGICNGIEIYCSSKVTVS